MNWTKKLISFHDFETTFISWGCPCLAYAFNKQKYNALEGYKSPNWCGPAIAYCGSQLIGGMLCYSYGTYLLNSMNIIITKDLVYGLVSVGSAMGSSCYSAELRTKIRQKYGIDGNTCNDVCVHYWCNPCASCQETAELSHHEMCEVENFMPFTHKYLTNDDIIS